MQKGDAFYKRVQELQAKIYDAGLGKKLRDSSGNPAFTDRFEDLGHGVRSFINLCVISYLGVNDSRAQADGHAVYEEWYLAMTHWGAVLGDFSKDSSGDPSCPYYMTWEELVDKGLHTVFLMLFEAFDGDEGLKNVVADVRGRKVAKGLFTPDIATQLQGLRRVWDEAHDEMHRVTERVAKDAKLLMQERYPIGAQVMVCGLGGDPVPCTVVDGSAEELLIFDEFPGGGTMQTHARNNPWRVYVTRKGPKTGLALFLYPLFSDVIPMEEWAQARSLSKTI